MERTLDAAGPCGGSDPVSRPVLLAIFSCLRCVLLAGRLRLISASLAPAAPGVCRPVHSEGWQWYAHGTIHRAPGILAAQEGLSDCDAAVDVQ